MLVNWIFVLFVPGWNIIITDPLSGKVSRARLFAAVCFFVAIGLSIVSSLKLIEKGQPLDNLTMGLLFANGLGLTGMTGYFAQQNRKTVDPESGGELKPNPPEPDLTKLPS